MRNGRERHGRRPAIVWQDTRAYPLQTELVIPLTSKKQTHQPGTVAINPTATNGLTTFSVALVFPLSAGDTRRFRDRVGTLDQRDLDAFRVEAVRVQKL